MNSSEPMLVLTLKNNPHVTQALFAFIDERMATIETQTALSAQNWDEIQRNRGQLAILRELRTVIEREDRDARQRAEHDHRSGRDAAR